MQEIESEGKSVKEAIDGALSKLGLRRDQVEVQILQEPTSGFIGIGAKPARVRITEKRWGPDGPCAPAPQQKTAELPPRRAPSPAPARRPHIPPPPTPSRAPQAASRPAAAPPAQPEAAVDKDAAVREAASLLGELLGLMGLESPAPAVSWDPVQERVKAVINGPDADKVVGPDGRALESLQFLTTLMVSRKAGASVAVQVDALGYWQKKEQEILSQAQRGIDEVKHTGRPFRLAPMDATMRRLIHRNLADHPDVETASEGEGAWRKIVLRPRKR